MRKLLLLPGKFGCFIFDILAKIRLDKRCFNSVFRKCLCKRRGFTGIMKSLVDNQYPLRFQNAIPTFKISFFVTKLDAKLTGEFLQFTEYLSIIHLER